MNYMTAYNIIFMKSNLLEDIMGCKKLDISPSFADLVLESTLKYIRSLKELDQINRQIDWPHIENLLFSFCTVSTKQPGR